MSLDIGGSARLRSPGAGYEVRGRHPARYREGTPRIGGNQTTRSSPDCDRVTRTASVGRSRRLASMAAPPSADARDRAFDLTWRQQTMVFSVVTRAQLTFAAAA